MHGSEDPPLQERSGSTDAGRWRKESGVEPPRSQKASVMFWAREVEDELCWRGIRFLLDGAMGVEKLVGDEGEDRGATRRDASFGDQSDETREELADVLGGTELREAIREEISRKVGCIIGRLGHSETEVPSTETFGQCGETTAFAVREGIAAARGGKRDGRCLRGGNGVDNGSGHWFLQ